jgi:hypothetical protein
MPIIQEVKYGEDNPIEAAPKLTEEEEVILRDRMAALDKLLSDKELAKYKIEIMFERKRSKTAPTFGMMSFWESGAKFHGGGDTKMYFCAGKKMKVNDCDIFIPDSSNGYGHLVCPRCKNVWKGEQVDGEVGAKLTMQNWAGVLLKYFMKLDARADIYMKFPKYDIRVLTQMEQDKQMMGDALAKARGDKQKCIYPLKNIIRDTAAGADLYSRFLAFLRA